jgi:hypothetical protein
MTRIDPRGPRFAAALTSVVLALALVLPMPAATAAAGLQWLVFAIGAFAGLQYQPWGVVFRRVIRPRLAAAQELEDPRAPRFAQLVGFGLLTVALLGALLGLAPVYSVAIGAALLAALLNAVFDLCLGCEMYVRMQRWRKRPVGPLRHSVRGPAGS